MNSPHNPSPNFVGSSDENLDPLMDNFELSYLMFEDCGLIKEENSSSQSIVSSETFAGETGQYSGSATSNKKNSTKCRDDETMKKKEMIRRIAFRTRSKMDVMDDGYKWRKYGKKSVKNNINKRNYYKCSSGSCLVKKRIERDSEDPEFVITTYEGVHNHESPCTVYYNEMVPNENWSQKASSISWNSPP